MARLAKRLAKSQGPTGFSRAELDKVRKGNEVFAANLTKAMDGLGRAVLATYAATVLDVAMRMTIQDSSRFAANWKLAVNRDSLTTAWSPKKYGEAAEGGAQIGQRGAAGAQREAILNSKRLYYGYSVAGTQVTVTPDGPLGTKIGLGGVVGRPAVGSAKRSGPQLGALPRVELFNPIIAAGPASENYTANALAGKISVIGARAKAEIGQGMIQIMLQRQKEKFNL